MAIKKAKKKVPPRVVNSDGFTIEVDGEEYHPHEDETVSYRTRLNTRQMIQALRLQNLQVTDDSESLEASLGEVRTFLRNCIASTTWTDEDGEPYTSVEAMLDDAGMDELSWLLTNLTVGRTSLAEMGKGIAPST